MFQILVPFLHTYYFTTEDIDSSTGVIIASCSLCVFYEESTLGVACMDSHKLIIFLKILLCVYLKKESQIHLVRELFLGAVSL